MRYSEFAEVYDALASTTKKLEKISILAGFLKKLKEKGKSEWVYLLRGKVLPDYDAREFGISNKLVAKIIGKSFGISEDKVTERFKKIGDLGEVAEEMAEKKRQDVLFSKHLDAGNVFNELKKVVDIEGKGAVSKKTELVAGLLSNASGRESKYLIRTLLNDLRVGVADALLNDAIAEAFLSNEQIDEIEYAYDLANDFAVVFEAAIKGEKNIKEIIVVPGRPLKVMLPVKVNELGEGFRICGKPAAFEHKYDGFRMLIHKKGNEVWLFTRKLENVSKQFPDVVEAVKKNVMGDSFILDSEIVGYEPETKRYKPFEAISQRIKRKYDIDKLIKSLPVEINIFDVLFYNGKSLMNKVFADRRKLVEKIVKEKKMVIKVAHQIITGELKEAEKFYEKALAIGEEGVIIKKLDAPYRQGRKVGYMVKMKPEVNDLDLVIVGAEYGTGKRGGWLTSYIVACGSKPGKFLEVGKVSSGLKELEQEGGTTYEEMTELLKPLIVSSSGREVKVKPKIVVAVTYQNIQKSPNYTSGYALRFPRITRYRPDKSVSEITTIDEIKKEAERAERGFRGGLG